MMYTHICEYISRSSVECLSNFKKVFEQSVKYKKYYGTEVKISNAVRLYNSNNHPQD